jgi:uncharacterized membrane protein
MSGDPVDSIRRSIVAPSPATRFALWTAAAIIGGTALLLMTRYASLPELLPVHFRRDGMPNGWQYKTYARVLMPVFVQLALAVSFGAIAALLLSRSHGADDGEAADVRAASTAAEAVALIALIWVAFQGYAALALVAMWDAGRGGLGSWYRYLEVAGLVATAIVGLRAHLALGRPEPRPFVAEHWRLGQLYKNPADPALFVPTRDGSRWTLNFGRPVAAALLGLVILFGLLGPAAVLALALR